MTLMVTSRYQSEVPEGRMQLKSESNESPSLPVPHTQGLKQTSTRPHYYDINNGCLYLIRTEENACGEACSIREPLGCTVDGGCALCVYSTMT